MYERIKRIFPSDETIIPWPHNITYIVSFTYHLIQPDLFLMLFLFVTPLSYYPNTSLYQTKFGFSPHQNRRPGPRRALPPKRSQIMLSQRSILCLYPNPSLVLIFVIPRGSNNPLSPTAAVFTDRNRTIIYHHRYDHKPSVEPYDVEPETSGCYSLLIPKLPSSSPSSSRPILPLH